MIQLKLLDESAEMLGWFSWNSWMVKLERLDDSAETLG
jgi:hypothetical protein